jgi:PKD repeat protein
MRYHLQSKHLFTFLLMAAYVCSGGIAISQKTVLTVSGVELVISKNTDVSVSGKLLVKSSPNTGNSNSKEGEILNNGNLIIADSLMNQTGMLFSKSSNPYLANGIALSSAGTVLFNGNNRQSIISHKPYLTIFNNLSVNNTKGVKLNDTICALGKVDPLMGSVFLNGKNLELFYGILPFTKYDGFLGVETNQNNVWDTTTVLHYNLLNQRSGHIVAMYKDKPSFDTKASTLGLSIINTSLHVDTIQRGHLPLSYAGNGSIRKYFVVKTKNDCSDHYKITYLDSSDYQSLHIKEPDFHLFLNQGNSPVTYTQIAGSADITNKTVTGDASMAQNRSYILTVADSACDNPPTATLKANANVCTDVSFPVKVENLTRTYSQMIFYNWYKNGVLLTDTSNQIKDTLKSAYLATYKVKIYDNRGCFSYSSVTVTGRPIPEAYFKADSSKVGYCLGATSTLTDTSKIADHTTLTRHWFWSDGASSSIDTAQIASHTFHAPATYNVSMVSTSMYGCSDTIKKKMEVHPLPTALFAARNLCGDSSLYVKFTNKSSVLDPSKDGIYKAKWGFGNNDTVLAINPSNHLFATTGLKTIYLQVVSGMGCVSSFTDTVRVSSQKVNFTAASVCLGAKTNFLNLSTADGITPVYTWDFGDGTSSSGANPQKTFSLADDYEVTLHSQSGNCSDSLTRTVRVHALPSASFTSTNACLGTSVSFKPVDKNQKNYQWNIAGTSSALVSPVLAFNTAGSFDVSLTVTSDSGCVVTSTSKFQVYPRPKAAFTFSDVCLGDAVQCYNQSSITGASLTYQWSFNDDDITSKENPSFIFAAPAGAKNIKLVATSSQGCSDTLVKTVQVFPLPVAGMATSISYCDSKYTLNATVPSTVATVSSYVWNNGSRLPLLTVYNDGTYSVDITSDKGCHVKEAVTVKLNSAINPGLPNTKSFCGNGTLDASYANANCTWYYNGTETVHQRYLNVALDGWYKVVVSDQKCTGSDSVDVTINPVPQVSLGSDITQCLGTPVNLNAGSGFATYLWSSGQTDSQITVYSPASYKVTVTNASGCSNADTIRVSFLPVPAKTLPASISQCSIATIDAGDNASTYWWSTGATSQIIQVNTSGNYWVKISNGNQCFSFDTVAVTILPVDKPNLGNDITACEGNTVVLNAGAHDASYTYTWNKQTSSSSTFPATKTGRYIVELLNTTNGCSAGDTVMVEYKSAPSVNLGTDKALCNSLSVLLDAANTGSLTQWGSSVGLVSTQQTLTVKEAGKYWVTVMNANGCIASDTIQIYPSSASLVAQFIAASTVYTGDSVNFYDMSYPEPYTCSWQFGDGVSSSAFNPAHIFYKADTFQVSLVVNNDYCLSSVTKAITVKRSLKSSSISQSYDEHFIEILSSKLYPNPTNGEFTFEMTLSDNATVSVAIFDLHGSLIASDKIINLTEISKSYSLHRLKPGIYIFRASVGKNAATYKIIKL